MVVVMMIMMVLMMMVVVMIMVVVIMLIVVVDVGDAFDGDDDDDGGDDDDGDDVDLVIQELVANQEHNFTLVYDIEFEEITNIWNTAFNKYHLKLNLHKAAVPMIGRLLDKPNIEIGEYLLTQVISFKHLGSSINW